MDINEYAQHLFMHGKPSPKPHHPYAIQNMHYYKMVWWVIGLLVVERWDGGGGGEILFLLLLSCLWINIHSRKVHPDSGSNITLFHAVWLGWHAYELVIMYL